MAWAQPPQSSDILGHLPPAPGDGGCFADVSPTAPELARLSEGRARCPGHPPALTDSTCAPHAPRPFLSLAHLPMTPGREGGWHGPLSWMWRRRPGHCPRLTELLSAQVGVTSGPWTSEPSPSLCNTLTPHCPVCGPQALRCVIEEITTGRAKWHLCWSLALQVARVGLGQCLSGRPRAPSQVIADSCPAGQTVTCPSQRLTSEAQADETPDTDK